MNCNNANLQLGWPTNMDYFDLHPFLSFWFQQQASKFEAPGTRPAVGEEAVPWIRKNMPENTHTKGSFG